VSGNLLLEISAIGFVTPSFQTPKPALTSKGQSGALEHKKYHKTDRYIFKHFPMKKDVHTNGRTYKQSKCNY
jgi:hypothetical protein